MTVQNLLDVLKRIEELKATIKARKARNKGIDGPQQELDRLLALKVY